MKKIKFSFFALLLLGVVACRKSDTTTSASLSGNVNTDEAADMVAGSLSLNSNGLANVSADVTLDATAYANAHVACGTAKTDTISRHSVAGSAWTYSYHLTYNYVVNCDNNVPDNLSSDLTYSGSFSGPNMSSTNSGTSNFTVGGLAPASTDFVINGEYKRSGSFASKIDTTNHGSSNIDINVNALTVTRPGRAIASGNATFTITGDVPKKGNFSFTGTIVFNGDGTAKVTINGTVYSVNLVTGTRTKV
jgi:hypothetical protein